jgi:hypothetical protein
MSMTSRPPVWLDVWQRWVSFWFTPGDPTTMAFIRIVTGCLVVYVHLVYSFDLTAFFGRDAWFDLNSANRLRHEEPARLPSLDWEHNELMKSIVLPDGKSEQQAVVDWMRALPVNKAELQRTLRLIDSDGVVNRFNFPRYPTTGLPLDFPQLGASYTIELSPDPLVRSNTLKALAKEIPRDKKEAIPEPFDKLGEAELKLFARDLEAFHGGLPAGDNKLADRRAIVAYLNWLGVEARNNLLRFLIDHTDDKVPSAEREKQLEYLQYWGVEQRAADRQGSPVFSLWFHISDPWEMRIAHSVILLIMVMFTLGLFTRVTSILTWLAAASFLHRNPQVLFGQDTMMNILLIYLMIANSGGTLSLDRFIARYRAVRASLKRSGKIDDRTAKFLALPPVSVASNFAQRALQIHFCFIYMASGLSKLKGGTWWSADAVWQTLVNPEFTMIHFEWYQSLIRWVFTSRPIYSIAAAGGVAFTLFTEISLSFLVWTRLRPWILICGFLLHFNIGVFMGLLVFSLFMMTMLCSYLPGSVVRERLFGLPTTEADKVKRPFNLGVEADCKRAAWAVAADTNGRVELVPIR